LNYVVLDFSEECASIRTQEITAAEKPEHHARMPEGEDSNCKVSRAGNLRPG
jgi:hypothetical protein